MTNENMKLWDSVCKTDPSHTKQVSFGARKFTSIDPMYQIRRMTEAFGPIGTGWTYRAEYDFQETLVLCEITISYKTADGTDATYGPVMGAEEYKTERNGKVRFDTDAPKKAMTDALTKALSQLGMNADVFLGLFDDQKYVARMRGEFSQEEKGEEIAAQKKWADDLLSDLKNGTITLDKAKQDVKNLASKLNKGVAAKLIAEITQFEDKQKEQTND